MDEITLVKTKSGVQGYLASAGDLQSHRDALDVQDQIHIPILLEEKNPHARLFVSPRDGAGNNNFDDDPEG